MGGDVLTGTWSNDPALKYCECGDMRFSNMLTLPADAEKCPDEARVKDIPEPGEVYNIYEEVCGAGALALASKGMESGTSSAGRFLTGFAAGASVVAATAAALIAVRKCRKGSDIDYQKSAELI